MGQSSAKFKSCLCEIGKLVPDLLHMSVTLCVCLFMLYSAHSLTAIFTKLYPQVGRMLASNGLVWGGK